MKPPDVPAYVMPIVPPPGFTIETCAAEIVTADIARLIRSPAFPLNRSCAVSSAAVVVTVTGGPPGLIGYTWVARPVTVRVLEPPAVKAETENVTAPRSVGVNVPVYRPSPRGRSRRRTAAR